MRKKSWMKIHTYLSLFFLPFALVYAITGVGYICGFQQDSFANIYEIPLDSMPERGQEKAALLELLNTHHLKIPANQEVHFIKGNPAIGNLAYSASISKNSEGKPTFRVVERSLYGVLLLMHKSHGTQFSLLGFKLSAFDIFAIGFGFSLLLFYLSGLIVTSFCERDRLVSFGILGLGVAVCALTVYVSM